HHPVEIAAALRSARAVTNGRVIAVVQPHRYSRLSGLFEEFCACFNDADAVIVADVYPAGGAPIEGASRDGLVEGLRRWGHRRVIPLEGPEALAGIVAEEAKAGDLVVLLGAGDITSWAYALPAGLPARQTPGAGATASRKRGAGCCSTRRWRPSHGCASAVRRMSSSCPRMRPIWPTSCALWTRASRSPPSGSAPIFWS